MTFLQTIAYVIFGLALAANAALAVYFGKRISVLRIPMQWDTDGKPIWYASRSIGLLWGLSFTLVVGAALFISARFADSNNTDTIFYSIMFLSVTVTLAQAWSLNMASKWANSQ